MVIAQVSKYVYENIYITGDILCFSTAGAQVLVLKGMIHPSHPIPSSFLPIQMIFVPIIGSLCCLSIIPPERQVQQCTRSFKVNSVESVSSLKRGPIAISDCIFFYQRQVFLICHITCGTVGRVERWKLLFSHFLRSLSSSLKSASISPFCIIHPQSKKNKTKSIKLNTKQMAETIVE